MISSVSVHAEVADPYEQYLSALIGAGLLIPSGVPGVYGLAGVFEDVIERFEGYVTRMGAHLHPEVMRFPPLLSRASYSQTDHMETFPNLMGSVHSFMGDERGHIELANKKAAGEDWSVGLGATQVMMTPAACYPLYPTATGTLQPQGRTVDLRSFVFRHEPSSDPARMQIFRQREYVRLGTPEQALSHRDYWLERGLEMLRAVGLDATAVVANDPFFGRGGRVMAATQREQTLKYELVVPVASAEKPTAVVSCNYHLEHFGHAFGIKTADGSDAHTACIGFGLERIALALFKTHGFTPSQWPTPVRNTLGL
jgi:seryl-tRNA synthetase